MSQSLNISANGAAPVVNAKPVDLVLFHFGGPTCQAEVEPFLYRLFMDPFIIRAPLGPLRALLARRISRKRSPEANRQYQEIGYSPINRYTEAQARHLQDLIKIKLSDVKVHIVNRYTEPSAKKVVGQIRWGRAKVVGLTLYPHLSHSTVVSSFRDFDTAAFDLLGNYPVMTKIYSWWWVDAYLRLAWQQLLSTLQEALADEGKVTVLFSAHGLPQKYVHRGDPYVNDVGCHFEALKGFGQQWLQEQGGDSLQHRVSWQLSFQSRVGPVEWVRPYTEDVIQQVGRDGGGTLLMVPISFVSDHIETLYEMDVTYQAMAKHSGCKRYLRVKPANDGLELAQALMEVLGVFGVS